MITALTTEGELEFVICVRQCHGDFFLFGAGNWSSKELAWS